MIEIGVSTLTDLQAVTVDGRRMTQLDRLHQVIELGVRADGLGLDIIGIGEHHSPDFTVSSPAVVLAAIAARTERIRLTSAVSLLSVHDPVRVYQDFAHVDLISRGRAELAVGRSAYLDPFTLFDVPLENYDDIFIEKLDLLLRIRASTATNWSGRFRPLLTDAVVTPRAHQRPLPVWVGVGRSVQSAARAGRLGLPLVVGYLGGTPESLRRITEVYRAAGEAAGQSDQLRVGIALHYFGAATEAEAESTYPYYRDFLRPKRPGGEGFIVSREQFAAGRKPNQALMIGTTGLITEKLMRLIQVVEADRVLALVDWGGLPAGMVDDSLSRLAGEIAPVVRAGA